MTIAVEATRMLLAGVFATAGVAKLLDNPGTRQGMKDFGAPASFAVPLAVLIPLTELTVAAMLFVPSSARWGAVGALCLLAVFTAAIANALAHGRTADCHCFGQLHSSRASWRTVARNIALGFLTGLVLTGAEHENDARAVLVATAALLLAVLGGASLLSLRLLYRRGRLPARLHSVLRLDARYANVAGSRRASSRKRLGLPVGSLAPDFRLERIDGKLVTLAALLAQRRPTMLLFTDPGCRPCVTLLPQVGCWQTGYRNELTIVIITHGSIAENRPKSEEHGLSNVLVQEGREVAAAYGANSVPSAVLVSTEGFISTTLALGEGPIKRLVDGHRSRPSGSGATGG